MNLTSTKSLEDEKNTGTLAIDLGNSTTVVAFQGKEDKSPRLLDLPPLTRTPGEIPSLVLFKPELNPRALVGNQCINLKSPENVGIISNFKRWIGVKNHSGLDEFEIPPEKAGELLLHQIWERLPPSIMIQRLVLTAPVECYRGYRSWLLKVCNSLPVKEIALVDESTAAAMGAGMPAGSKLLVIDIGGSTIDLSLVALEGGEGKAEPVAQLLRFDGQDLEGKSKQVMRCANVISKAGQLLGGRDIDRWIVNHLYPNESINESILNAAERLKCRLSAKEIKGTASLLETSEGTFKENQNIDLILNRVQLEELLIERGFLQVLENLLTQTLANANKKGCNLEDLQGVVLVGGGARIPLIKRWLEEQIKPSKLLTPPPIEAVAKGALQLTPGVRIRDVLQRGASLRFWDKKGNQHKWHPLFLAGQPWPTIKGLEIILSSSIANQLEIDLIIGEPEVQGVNEVIYIDGIPIVKEIKENIKVMPLDNLSKSIPLSPPGKPGEDCLRLNFNIDENCNLLVEGIDLRTEIKISQEVLGSIR